MSASNLTGYWWARWKATRNPPGKQVQVIYIEPHLEGWDKPVLIVGDESMFRLDEFELIEPLIPPTRSPEGET